MIPIFSFMSPFCFIDSCTYMIFIFSLTSLLFHLSVSLVVLLIDGLLTFIFDARLILMDDSCTTYVSHYATQPYS